MHEAKAKLMALVATESAVVGQLLAQVPTDLGDVGSARGLLEYGVTGASVVLLFLMIRMTLQGDLVSGKTLKAVTSQVIAETWATAKADILAGLREEARQVIADELERGKAIHGHAIANLSKDIDALMAEQHRQLRVQGYRDRQDGDSGGR